jgi:hypothetical protein
LFQRAVLDLCRAGVRDAPVIAAHLALPPELVAFVMDQLRETSLLDDDAAPTFRALKLLDEEQDVLQVEDAGYVFIDALANRLWPRFHRGTLPFVRAEFEREHVAKLSRGTEGMPENISASVLWPTDDGGNARPPTSLGILKAARHHMRRQRAFAREVASGDDADVILADSELGPIARARLVDPTPEPVFVAAFVIVPDDARHQSWLITDPCGLGISDVLRSEAKRLAENANGLVRHILEDLVGEAWHVDEGDLAHYLREANCAAADRVARRLGAAVYILPSDVVQRLADADARLDAARTQTVGRTKAIEDFLAHAYAAVEAAVGWIAAQYSDAAVLAVLGPSPTDNASLLARVASAQGFVTSELTIPLLLVGHATVKNALRRGTKTLPGSIAAALLAAQQHDQHPLRALATRMPEALAFLVRMFRLRNEASHDTEALPSLDVALATRDELFGFLAAVLGSGSGLDATSSALPPDLTWGSDLMLRVRARAVQSMLEYPGIEEFPELRTRLVEAHHLGLLVQLLAGDSGSNVDVGLGSRVRDFVVASAIAVEAAIAELERRAPSDARIAEEISDTRTQNAALVNDCAQALQFSLTEAGVVPTSISHARPHSIRRAAEGRGETLSASVIVQLLSARSRPDHPLREVARSSPRFLLNVAKIVEARGHGDEVRLHPKGVRDFVVLLQETVRAVLAAVD